MAAAIAKDRENSQLWEQVRICRALLNSLYAEPPRTRSWLSRGPLVYKLCLCMLAAA